MSLRYWLGFVEVCILTQLLLSRKNLDSQGPCLALLTLNTFYFLGNFEELKENKVNERQ